MVSRAQKFRLGIFLVVISILMIIFLVLVAGNKIMEKRDTYYIKYQDLTVSGLQIGGPVRYHGIAIGRVDEINIDAEDVTSVIVVVSVKAGTPLKKDVSAALTPIGITGLLPGSAIKREMASNVISSGNLIFARNSGDTINTIEVHGSSNAWNPWGSQILQIQISPASQLITQF